MNSRQTRALALMASHGAVTLFIGDLILTHPEWVQPSVDPGSTNAIPVFFACCMVGLGSGYSALLFAEETKDAHWHEGVSVGAFGVMMLLFFWMLVDWAWIP
jgi:hypothetical protein